MDMSRKCPNCDSSEEVRIILWGMPSEEPDSSKYVIGGCTISGDRPDYHCLKCATDFFRKKNEWRNRFIWDNFDGISVQCSKCREWFLADERLAQHKD